MARYPGADWRRCPGTEPPIRPTQLIFHTAVMRDLVGLRNYFCSGRSGGIESHFGVGGRWAADPGQDGDVEQWRDTEEQADANRSANRRPDGTGAISVETCDNAPQLASQIETWTPRQATALIRLGRWVHTRHGIPLRICRSPDDPGYGWHAMWDNTRYELSDGSTPWTPSAGKECPGPKRIAQLKATILPAIFTGRDPEEDDMPTEAEIRRAMVGALAEQRDDYAQTIGDQVAASLEPLLQSLSGSPHVFIRKPNDGTIYVLTPAGPIHVPNPSVFGILSGNEAINDTAIEVAADDPIWG